jgi:hypothetical protein
VVQPILPYPSIPGQRVAPTRAPFSPAQPCRTETRFSPCTRSLRDPLGDGWSENKCGGRQQDSASRIASLLQGGPDWSPIARVQREPPCDPSAHAPSPQGTAGASFTARIGRAMLHRTRSASKNDGLADPCLFPIFDCPFDLSTGFTGFDRVAAVVELLAFGESEFHLGMTAL